MRVLGAISILFLVLTTACADDGTEPDPGHDGSSSLLIRPDSARITTLGGTLDLSAWRVEGTDTSAAASASWRSGNEAVATVDASGVVTTVGVGSAEIGAVADGDSASARVVVDTMMVLTLGSTTTELVLVPEGDTLALDLGGVGAQLIVPAGAVADTVTVRATPITGVSDAPIGALVGALHLEPSGLTFLDPLVLSVELPSSVDPASLAGFSYRGDGAGFQLLPFELEAGRLTLRISHLSGYGAGDGSEVNCASQGASPYPPDAAKQEIACVLMRAGNDPSLLAAADRAEIEAAFTYWLDYLVVAFDAAGTGSLAAVIEVRTYFAEWLGYLDVLGFTEDMGGAIARGWTAMAGALEGALGVNVIPTLQAVAADHSTLEAAVELWGSWTGTALLVQGVLGEASLASARIQADDALSAAVNGAISQRDQLCTAEEDASAKRTLLQQLLHAYGLLQLWVVPGEEYAIPWTTLCGGVLNRAETVTVGPTPVNLGASGRTIQLLAYPLTLLGDPPIETRPMTWTTRDDSVATVNGSGVVTATGEGETWIVVEVDEARDSAEVSVQFPLPTLNVYVGHVPDRSNVGFAAKSRATGVDSDTSHLNTLDHTQPGCESATGVLAHGHSWSTAASGPFSSAESHFSVHAIAQNEVEIRWRGRATAAASVPDTLNSWSAQGDTYLWQGELLLDMRGASPDIDFAAEFDLTATASTSGDSSAVSWRFVMGRGDGSNKVDGCSVTPTTLIELYSSSYDDGGELQLDDSARKFFWAREGSYQNWIRLHNTVNSTGHRYNGEIVRAGGTASLDYTLRIRLVNQFAP